MCFMIKYILVMSSIILGGKSLQEQNLNIKGILKNIEKEAIFNFNNYNSNNIIFSSNNIFCY